MSGKIKEALKRIRGKEEAYEEILFEDMRILFFKMDSRHMTEATLCDKRNMMDYFYLYIGDAAAEGAEKRILERLEDLKRQDGRLRGMGLSPKGEEKYRVYQTDLFQFEGGMRRLEAERERSGDTEAMTVDTANSVSLWLVAEGALEMKEFLYRRPGGDLSGTVREYFGSGCRSQSGIRPVDLFPLMPEALKTSIVEERPCSPEN